MTWTFRRMSRAEMNTDPIEGEFFTPEGLSDALIRETIQNSLDARPPGSSSVVRVRLFLSGDRHALPPIRASQYLRHLWPHLRAPQNDRSDLPADSERMSFLCVEDFGTRGLSGRPDEETDVDDPEGTPNDFFYFWRNIGRSKKHETERGRWGLGKTVFPASSRINSFFGLTVRLEDSRSLLMGQSVLKVHHLDGGRFCPYGFFAHLAEEEFPMPFDDETTIDRFRRDFQLERTTQPGLSVVVPFPDEELTANKMLRAAVLHYFFPIIRGDLIVEVCAEHGTSVITAGSISDIAEQVDWAETRTNAEDVRRLFSMVREIGELSDDDVIRLPESPQLRSPDWNTGRFDGAAIQRLKQRFEAGQIVAVRVPVTVKTKSGQLHRSFFNTFVQYDESLPRPDDYYIRQGITISNISRLKERGFRSLVVVEDGPLSTLLGDAENPAHTEWQDRAPKLKERYEWGTYTVRFVCQAPQRIVSQLLARHEGRDEELLKNIFYLDVEGADGVDQMRSGRGRKRAGGTPPEPGELPRQPSQFLVSKIEGGFRVRSRQGVRPHAIAVNVAYQVRRGNPFKKYDALDFALDTSPIAITSHGATCEATLNALTITPTDDVFSVDVTGFDAHRDLTIRAMPEVDDAQEVQLHGAEEDQPVVGPVGAPSQSE